MNIQMGNDEFILYIRKNGRGSGKSTAELGQRIWEWLQANDPGAIVTARNQPCRWGDAGGFISMDDLPKTAAQFSFDRALLPRLYDYLDSI
jgi:hypothetical protein